jgi:hypothetical protein
MAQSDGARELKSLVIPEPRSRRCNEVITRQPSFMPVERLMLLPRTLAFGFCWDIRLASQGNIKSPSMPTIAACGINLVPYKASQAWRKLT